MSLPFGSVVLFRLKHMESHQKSFVTASLNENIGELRLEITLRRAMDLVLLTVDKRVILVWFPRVAGHHAGAVAAEFVNLLLHVADKRGPTPLILAVVLTGDARL